MPGLMFRSGLIGLFLLMCSACSRTETVTVSVPVRILPPEALMQTVEVPEMAGTTTKALASWAVELKTALERANANMEAIREWADAADE